MHKILGPYCRDKMERKCAIDAFYYPEESNTSDDQTRTDKSRLIWKQDGNV